MQRTLLRGLRLIVIGGMLSATLVGCTSVKNHTPPLSTGTTLPNQTEHPQQPTLSVTNPKSDQTMIASNQDKKHDADLDESTDYPFNRDDVRLKGINLKADSNEVTALWGEPEDHITMEDKEQIDVMEYDGFSIGCDRYGQVKFIEVSGYGTSTGIHGLKVGDHDYDARKALGEPDQDSGYVWRYITDDSLLRLDLDPKTNIVQSVKLFPYES